MTETIVLQDGFVHLSQRKVERGGGTTRLTAKEAKLLAYLAEHPGKTVPREDLLENVWGYNRRVATRTIDITVRRLRTKIERDPAEPRHIVTVHGEGYVFQPLRRSEAAPSTRRGAFPVDPSQFFGRDQQLRTITQLFNSKHRIVTICGPGGQGKTRLARAFAMSRIQSIGVGEAVFVDLTPCRNRTDMLVATATAFGAQFHTGATIDNLETQVRRLVRASGALLVVFDNYEQIVEEAADALAGLIACAPKLLALTTSREALRVAGEKCITLGPLSANEAVSLFVERRADFENDDLEEERAGIELLVSRLDHHPLAVELAAARASELSVAELTDRLDQRFELLRFGRRDAPERHQTLWATIDWSWAMLSPKGQSTLTYCSVFFGSFDLASAQAILDGTPSVTEMEQQLWELQRKSLLVSRMTESGHRRLSLPVSIRDYASTKLAESGDHRALLKRAAAYYCELVERCETLAPLSSDSGPFDHINLDIDNILEVQRQIAPDDPTTAARLGVGVLAILNGWAPCDLQLPAVVLTLESARRASSALLARALVVRVRTLRSLCQIDNAEKDFEELNGIQLDPPDPVLALQIEHLRGLLCCDRNEHEEGRRILRETASGAEAIKERSLHAECLVDAASVEVRFGSNAVAQSLLEQALAVYDDLGHRRGQGTTHDFLGWTHLKRGELTQAEEHLKASLTIHRERQDARLEAEALHSLVYLALERGAPTRARDLLEHILELKQGVDADVRALQTQGSLGVVALEMRELGRARDLLAEAARESDAMGNQRQRAGILACAAAVEALDQQDPAARGLLAKSEALLESHGAGWGSDIIAVFEVLVDCCDTTQGAAKQAEYRRTATPFLEQEVRKSGTSMLHRAAVRVLSTELSATLAVADTIPSRLP